ncbi:NAD(P)-dependent oxidoreductase [Olivibacter sp. XZL3]|uniref:NAD-dependent epimerase/dehydratase family protein n=1 Tax=Olivibacter sp. XZL3 TaxID=1735116 RepID=UPI00106528C1|nr:NAD-dependent epimerase/dehydratase family protein [Olivibacter sp. XZL3]
MEALKQRYETLLAPSAALINDLKDIDGDLLILGVGGKMGPNLARLARQALDEAGKADVQVIGVSRFSDTQLQQQLEAEGIRTIAADLLNDNDLQSLPFAPNVIFMAGNKFGTTGKEAFTWAMNVFLPGRVADKYKNARMVVFSSGNIYPFVSVTSGGASEKVAPEPIGEYAQSCLGRERIFQYHAQQNGTPMLIYRLNYANDVSYGVLVEIGKAVRDGQAVDLTTANVNVIWQGDANEYALRSLKYCSTPPKVLNITGPETVSVKWVAEIFGEFFNRKPTFEGTEEGVSLLNNAAESFALFGYPRTPLKTMIGMIAAWLDAGAPLLNKPTHFQEREGKF